MSLIKRMASDRPPLTEKSIKQMRIEQIALQLAWDDLDEDDRRVYMREAQKQISREDKERGY